MIRFLSSSFLWLHLGGSGEREEGTEGRIERMKWLIFIVVVGHFIEGQIPPAPWIGKTYEKIRLEVDEKRRRGEGIEIEYPHGRGVTTERVMRKKEEVEDENMMTGGFLPLSLWKESENEGEGEEDRIANSVWMPKRVGEWSVVVGLDRKEEYGEEKELEFDGGVDCSG